MYVQERERERERENKIVAHEMSGMDILEFGCVMTGIIVPALLIFVWLSTRNALIMQDLAEKRRISLERSKAAKARYEQDAGPDIAPWVGELLGSLGVSPDMLFQDEMPPELVKLMPMIQSFLKSGGLQKLIAQLGNSQGAGESQENKGYI